MGSRLRRRSYRSANRKIVGASPEARPHISREALLTLPHQTFAKDRVIIMSAPNGARRTADDHPALPISPRELADCAQSLVEEGVSVLHLHVRDKHQKHTIDADCYRAAMKAVRERVGNALVLQVTSEAVGIYARDEQMAMVRTLKPEAVSLGLRELCPDDKAEVEAAAFFAWLRKENIWPQYILYSADDVTRFDHMRRRGVFTDEHPFCLLVMGRYTDALEGSLPELAAMLEAANCCEFPWAACCFGQHENDAMLEATRAGGHVRIGFENNLCLPDGSIARDNAQLINKYRSSAMSYNRIPATADDIRSECMS